MKIGVVGNGMIANMFLKDAQTVEHAEIISLCVRRQSLEKGQGKPGTGTESLYKVVQIEHSGTLDDPIPWVHNMVLEEGKYYTDKEVLYLCIRDSGIGMAFDLENLVSGGYVQVVENQVVINN